MLFLIAPVALLTIHNILCVLCDSTIAPALSYYRPSMDICVALLTGILALICVEML